ncbi:hypothetical protein [Actinokineospora sp.]|uniref:hypothetical protein n=1 Tax=Actinokineospora sp. TaxID=1872133 RepID=UPI0040379216
MIDSTWVCDGCHTNNEPSSGICRRCKRQAGSTTSGEVRTVVTEVIVPHQESPPPVFVESQYAKTVELADRTRHSAPRMDTPRITLATPPPPPVRPVPPAREPVSRSAPRAGWGVSLVILIIAAIAAFGLLAERDSADTAPRTADPTSTATPTAAGCPDSVASWLPGGGAGATLVAEYTTDRHLIALCRTADGALYYDGRLRGQAATRDSHISLPATPTATGFFARNGNYTYEISGLEITVSRANTVILHAALTRTA